MFCNLVSEFIIEKKKKEKKKQLVSAEHKIQSRKSVLPLALWLFFSLKRVE